MSKRHSGADDAPAFSKRCGVCRQIKPLDDFAFCGKSQKKGSVQNRRAECSSCLRQLRREKKGAKRAA